MKSYKRSSPCSATKHMGTRFRSVPTLMRIFPRSMADPVQVQQVMMNLIMNSIDAMKEIDRSANSPSGRGAGGRPATNDFGQRYRCGVSPQQRTRYSMLSLPPSLTASAWDFGSAVPSLNRTAAACGQPDNSPRGANFSFTLPIQSTSGAIPRKAIGTSYQRMIAPPLSWAHSLFYELS